MKTIWVLAGGGSLGAVQVGMLKALVDAGVSCDRTRWASTRTWLDGGGLQNHNVPTALKPHHHP